MHLFAVVALHNLLMAQRSRNDPYNYCPFNYVDQEIGGNVKAGEWRKGTENGGMLPIGRSVSNNYSGTAKEIRRQFKEYFNSPEGSVSWQLDMVTRVANYSDMYR